MNKNFAGGGFFFRKKKNQIKLAEILKKNKSNRI